MKLTSTEIAILVLALTLGSCTLLGQTQSQLTGAVTDATGAVVPGAAVTIRNAETGATQHVSTNESGIFAFPYLQPGRYALACEMPGFKKYLRRGDIVLETGLVSRVDIVLELGDVTEVVEVTASSPILESESATVGALIERATVQDLPVESRRAGSLARLLGTVVLTTETGQESTPRMSIAGGRGDNQMYNLDGAVAQNTALGTAFLSLNPPAEALQEFRVQTSNYSSEFGRAGGGLILMTTRSGTNEFHGAAYEFLRNDKMDARSFFAPGKAPLRYNIFGGTLGGRIVRDKTFFFVNYEGTRRRDGLTFANVIVPHPSNVFGDFSARRDVTVLDPSSNTPFPGNVIPSTRIDPVGQAFAKFYPAPNVASNDVTRAPRNNYVTNVADGLSQNYLTLKVDQNSGQNNRFSGRFIYMKAFTDTAAVYPDATGDYRAGTRPLRHTNGLANWIRILGPALVNDARYSGGWRFGRNSTPGAVSGTNGRVGLRGVDAEGFPWITVTGLSALGRNMHGRDQGSLTHQFVDTLTWMKGKHQFKTGFELRYSLNEDIFNTTGGGGFTFSNRATNDGLAALLLGWTTSAQRQTTDMIASRSDFYGAFFQDDWKVLPRLTLNLGVRWDLDTPRWERDNHQSGFDGSVMNPVAGVPGVITFSGRDGRGKYAHDFDANNFGPRVGFAYRAGARTVLRGGYGIFYLGAYTNVVAILTNGFGDNASFESPDGGFTPAFLFRNGLPAPIREELGPGFGAVRVGQAPRMSTGFLQKDHRNGYSQQWNFTIQRAVTKTILLEVGYIGNAGHKLASSAMDINQIPLVGGRGPARQDQRLRLFPQFSGVTVYSPPWGDSSYHALNTKIEKRFSGGLGFTANLTWAKFLDNAVSGSELGGSAGSGYTHYELRGLDKSYSGNDVRLRWVSSAVYELPFGRGRAVTLKNPLLNGIAGGWGLGVIAELRTGAPYGAIEQTNRGNAFSGSPRPNLLWDPAIHGKRSRGEMLAHYFDTGAFEMPAAGVFGNAARNVGFGPGFAGMDVSAHKVWPLLSERINLRFRSDVYNLPNRPNFANPARLRGRADFGQIAGLLTGTGGRVFQLSLRLEF